MCIRIYIFNLKKQTSKKKQSKAIIQKNAKQSNNTKKNAKQSNNTKKTQSKAII